MINDLKELQKLFKLCRAQGVTDIKVGNLDIKFGELSTTQAQMDEQAENSQGYANFPSGELTPSQLAFYSSGGNPADDPENRDAV